MSELRPLLDQNFLEYASYVIRERAIPDVEDGLKPVQRRILHTMFKMDDGKFNKVANIVGETMKLHPHGDASISSALVVIANKEYFIDKQGNFGNPSTGDPASAARYIEARLTPLAKEVLFNPDLTETVESYDGRNQEPVRLPCKIPATLLLGAEGIAVGMSTRILPHNFNEVLEAQIAYLEERAFELFPDFLSGGLLDVTQYKDGNGKVRSRASIEQVDEKTLVVRELPFGVTTESLIQSLQDAVNKGKFKLSQINDFTTEKVEIELRLPRGVNADQMLKPLYAFTQCEVSLSTNLLVIRENQPTQMTTSEVIRHNTDRLVALLRKELHQQLHKLREQWHHKKMEQFFVTEQIYRQLEDCETYPEVLQTVEKAMHPLAASLQRRMSREDFEKLLGLQIKRLSKFDRKQSDRELSKLEREIHHVERQLSDVVKHTILYLRTLQANYGERYPRRTKIQSFDEIQLREVAESRPIFWDKKGGYLGSQVEGKEVAVCTQYDKLVLFTKSHRYQVIRMPEKMFVGKHLSQVFKEHPETIYNIVYTPEDDGVCFVKRFQISKFILDKEYELFPEFPKAKILYFSTGQGIFLEYHFVPHERQRKSREFLQLDELLIKNPQARGNRLSPKPIQSIREIKKLPDDPQIALLDAQSEAPDIVNSSD
jgi:topoisomerase-4 subunit A